MGRFAGLALLLAACAPDFVDQRDPIEVQSFGTEVTNSLCRRIAYLEDLEDGDGVVDVRGDRYRQTCLYGTDPGASAPARLQALIATRSELIGAIDTAVPEDQLAGLQDMLSDPGVLELYDDGTMPRAVAGLGGMLEAWGADAELTAAISRFHRRVGYAPARLSRGVLRASVSHPRLGAFLERVPSFLATGQGQEGWRTLQDGLAASLAGAEAPPDPGAADRSASLAADLLLAERPLLGGGEPVWIAVRDHRGQALTTTASAPFTDADGDGLADFAADGRFVGPGGELLAITPFPVAGDPWPYRDAEGRALISEGGALAFEYIDLDRTLLAALMRDFQSLFDSERGGSLDLLRGAGAMMGERGEVTRSYPGGGSVTYLGYLPESAALLDIVHGYLSILAAPNIDEVLELSRNLVTTEEDEAARLMEAVISAARLGDRFPEAELVPGSPLYDDMIRVVERILEVDGLAEDLIRSLENPEVANLAARLAEQMTYTDEFHFDASDADGGYPVIGDFTTEVDRSRPDVGSNRSLMRRMLHAISESNGMVACNKQDGFIEFVGIEVRKYDECALLQIDNVAVFFVQAIAGTAELDFDFGGGVIGTSLELASQSDTLMEEISGIDGFDRTPSPQALARLLFLDPSPDFVDNLLLPPKNAWGEDFRTKHAGTFPVWDLNGFYASMRPVVRPFAEHDAEQLFVDLLVVLHDHWPSPDSEMQSDDPTSVNYAYRSNIVSYEPLVAAILTDTDLLAALVETAPAINAVSGGARSAPGVIADAARFFFHRDPGLRSRVGASTSSTADGRPVDVLSRWQLVADGYERRTAYFAANPAAAAAWDRGTRQLVDALVRGVDDGGWRFRSPRFSGVTAALTEFVAARVDAHVDAGDLDAWVSEELPADVERIMTSPVFVGAADVAQALERDAPARAELDAMMAHLFATTGDDPLSDVAIAAAADLVMLNLDDDDLLPLVTAIGPWLRHDVGMVQGILAVTGRSAAAAEDDVLVTVLRQLLTGSDPGRGMIDPIFDAIIEVQREEPGTPAEIPLAPGDYASIFTAVGSFFADEQRGLHKFTDIVARRRRR